MFHIAHLAKALFDTLHRSKVRCNHYPPEEFQI